ncbi:LOW QUALITY PROTEIN: uncharacterized protein [Blastocystis hominis]|uniref:Uncharacterized protein n=1 Tax=Blastocystis hominis TaxID=12968 RepID=D8M482_BLAHO|nr:LOW QUALITY PROTEIN: uncharacterized protein [Blastocystis hominis]CBK22871.2 unnamed protein product [Blastocystis hominis]|eukprot:XP_012896919.1 LOW QUALITY PROTEIN: uncharacterized protein [Blastocystis hominis]
MFQVLNEYDQTIPKIVEEAITNKEAQWKTAMNEVVSNSQIELKSLQDQLILSKRQLDSVNLALHAAQQQTRDAKLEIEHRNAELAQLRETLSGAQCALQSAKDELNQREQTQKTLESEYAQRIELYRRLIEDEKQQQTRLRGQIEEAARTAGASQIQAETAGKTLEEARKELSAQQEAVRQREEEIARLEQEKQGLTLAVHNLMHKNDVLGDQAKQAQAQFESFSASLQERMDAMQKQYEEQLASLRSQLQTAKIESAMMEREEEGPSGTNVAKQLQFQAEQIQSLKVGEMEGMGGKELGAKEGQVAELMSYVEKLLRR